MHLIKKDMKVYVLFSNVENINENYNKFRDPAALPYSIQKDYPIWFQGEQGAFLVKIEEIHKVKRILPHDTTARSYWGEFRRSHKMIPRLTKLVNFEEDYILECEFLEPVSQEKFDEYLDNSYEFRSYVTAEFDEFSFHGVSSSRREKRQKTWNITNERFLGPNLKDYSTNDCYKYYTLL